jgi:chitinase
MQKKFLQAFLLCISIVYSGMSKKATAQPCKEVIGYYPGWQWYDRNKLVKPTSIDYSKYTILNYAFLYPLPDGSITITDPWSDKNLLLGDINWAVAPAGYDTGYDLGNPAYHLPNTSLIHHAHQNNVKVMISMGGWTLSNDFAAIAADVTKRTNFAHWCNEVVRTYDIDGIDIDWEYPGYTPHNGTPNDITNYTLMLQEIRDSLDAIEPIMGKDLMLTAAFGAAPDRMDDIEWNNIVQILDYINLMSYDFFGAFSPETNHNSPLYTPAQGDTTFNLNSAVSRLINTHNVPADKINAGIAFYGRTAKTVSAAGLHVPTTGATDDVTFSADEGSPQYFNILESMSLFTFNWDSNAEVPYLTGDNGLNTFVSYDDEQSIALKAQYVVNNQLAGVIIWEITGDYIETAPGSGIIAGTPLADTLNTVLCQTTVTGLPENLPVSTVEVFPNPASNQIQLNTEMDLVGAQISIYNAMGKLVYNSAATTNNPIVLTSDWAKGMYLLEVTMTDQKYQSKFLVIE